MLQDTGDSAVQAISVTTSDSTVQPFRRLWVGGAGNLSIVNNGVTVVYKSVPAGTYIRVQGTGVNETGTDATDIVAEN